MRYIYAVEVEAPGGPEQAEAYLASMPHVTVLAPPLDPEPPEQRITEGDLLDAALDAAGLLAPEPACTPPVWHPGRHRPLPPLGHHRMMAAGMAGRSDDDVIVRGID